MQNQSWDDIISQFALGQQRILSFFSKLVSTYPENKRQEIIQLIGETADEMEHHGYYSSPYHSDLSEGLKKLLGLSSHTAEAFMMSYQLATPAIRKNLKNEIGQKSEKNVCSSSLLRNQRSIIYRSILKNKLNRYADKIPSLGDKILWVQMPPLRSLNHKDINSNHPLQAIFFRLAQLPASKRHQVRNLILKSRQLTNLSGIDRGISYLAQKMLPILDINQLARYPSKKQKKHSLKVKRLYNILKIFGFLLLTQHPQDQDDWMKTMEIKRQNQIRKLFFYNNLKYDHCCCCE